MKNYYPEKIKYKDIAYRKQIPMMQNLLELKDQNKLSAEQKFWFQTKTEEELYDVANDPYQLNNLSDNPMFTDQLNKFRKTFEKHQKKHQDFGSITELEMLQQMWPNLKQPTTASPKVKNGLTGVQLSCKTKGASIAYIVSDSLTEQFDYDSDWQLYSKPITPNRGKYLYIIAERIGYKESDIVIHKL